LPRPAFTKGLTRQNDEIERTPFGKTKGAKRTLGSVEKTNLGERTTHVETETNRDVIKKTTPKMTDTRKTEGTKNNAGKLDRDPESHKTPWKTPAKGVGPQTVMPRKTDLQ
jgi:hypothetical protein